METLPFAKSSQVRTYALNSLIPGVSMFLSNEGASKVLALLEGRDAETLTGWLNGGNGDKLTLIMRLWASSEFFRAFFCPKSAIHEVQEDLRTHQHAS